MQGIVFLIIIIIGIAVLISTLSSIFRNNGLSQGDQYRPPMNPLYRSRYNDFYRDDPSVYNRSNANVNLPPMGFGGSDPSDGGSASENSGFGDHETPKYGGSGFGNHESSKSSGGFSSSNYGSSWSKPSKGSSGSFSSGPKPSGFSGRSSGGPKNSSGFKGGSGNKK